MGMKRKRLVYVKKYGKKFGAWLRKCGKLGSDTKPAPTVKPAPVVEPEPVVVDEPIAADEQE